MAKKFELPTIGEILYEEFMEPLNVSAYRLAKDINVPVSRIQDIIHNRRGISVDTSIRLGRYFKVSDRFFLNLQNEIDIRNIQESLNEEFEKISPIVNDNSAIISKSLNRSLMGKKQIGFISENEFKYNSK